MKNIEKTWHFPFFETRCERGSRSHWHEFLLYKSEGQQKFEELFARRPRRVDDLERRLRQAEELQAERLEEKLDHVRDVERLRTEAKPTKNRGKTM